MNYTAENPNYYTQDWTMNVDCFIDKKGMQTFLPAIEKKQRIEVSQVNAFNTNELVFELRRNMRVGKTLLLYYAFLAVPIIILTALNINNYFITLVLTLMGIVGFIYFITKKGKKGTGFYMTIQNSMVSFLHLESRNEIFSASVNSVATNVYIGNLSGKGYNIYYLIMKLKVPGFKNITIGQTSPWGRNVWQGRNIKVKWLVFSPPDYVIDAENWEKLARVFNITI
ncbi:MAG: hypothetical protein IPJ81_17245 [Chitinophagaceae bacterium]|nr:hypothetical protein [Chitinophagaceae bacterium]